MLLDLPKTGLEAFASADFTFSMAVSH